MVGGLDEIVRRDVVSYTSVSFSMPVAISFFVFHPLTGFDKSVSKLDPPFVGVSLAKPLAISEGRTPPGLILKIV